MTKNDYDKLQGGFVVTATGKQLDDIGEPVGCQRNDKFDELESDIDFRKRVMERIKIKNVLLNSYPPTDIKNIMEVEFPNVQYQYIIKENEAHVVAQVSSQKDEIYKRLFEIIPAVYRLTVEKIKINHLKYSYMTAQLKCGEMRHAQKVMKDLGITYQHATPQSIGDQWWFWNCENIPEKLPEYLTELDANPMECIGFGLTKEDAEKIRDYKS